MSHRPGQSDIDLDGKRILITGASSGIGEAAAIKFARLGATVVVVARRRDLLDDVADRILADGGDALAIDCDLADLDAVDALAARVEKEIGGVDILVNNAGRSIRRPLAESLERWHDVERTMTPQLLLAAAADPRPRARACSNAATATSSTSRAGGC